MFQVTVRTMIAAPIGQVWAELSDLSGFGTWNPLIVAVDDQLPRGWSTSRPASEMGVRLNGGDLRPGDPITISVALADGVHLIDVTVSRTEPQRGMGWSFTERARWWYRGEHVFSLEIVNDGQTRLVDTERFWGLSVLFRRRALATRITASMTLMGEALKNHVETER